MAEKYYKSSDLKKWIDQMYESSLQRGDVMPLFGGAISMMMGIVMLGITFQDREFIKAAGILCAATCAVFAALCFIVFFIEW